MFGIFDSNRLSVVPKIDSIPSLLPFPLVIPVPLYRLMKERGRIVWSVNNLPLFVTTVYRAHLNQESNLWFLDCRSNALRLHHHQSTTESEHTRWPIQPLSMTVAIGLSVWFGSPWPKLWSLTRRSVCSISILKWRNSTCVVLVVLHTPYPVGTHLFHIPSPRAVPPLTTTELVPVIFPNNSDKCGFGTNLIFTYDYSLYKKLLYYDQIGWSYLKCKEILF